MATTTTPGTAAPETASRAQARPDLEQQRNEAEQRARRDLDQDAVAAIEETRKALQAIADGKTDEAVAAIERATGKIDVLTARNPAAALLAVDVRVRLIDTAPRDMDEIRARADAADAAMLLRDFPLARVLLGSLISELRVRTYHLPLATYPTALREAARLLDERKYDEARGVLEVALNTLVIIDRIIPLPLVVARVAIDAAEGLRDQDRDAAARLLNVARDELNRAMELGYMGKDDEYRNLSKTISDLEKQLKGTENTTSTFAQLKQRLADFFKRLTGNERSSQPRRQQQSSQQSSQTPDQPRATEGASAPTAAPAPASAPRQS